MYIVRNLPNNRHVLTFIQVSMKYTEFGVPVVLLYIYSYHICRRYIIHRQASLDELDKYDILSSYLPTTFDKYIIL